MLGPSASEMGRQKRLLSDSSVDLGPNLPEVAPVVNHRGKIFISNSWIDPSSALKDLYADARVEIGIG
jgi:hypothetical protein